MKIQKFCFIAFTLALVGMPVLANDAHHDGHAAPAGKAAAPAADAHAAPKADAPPAAAVPGAAVAAKEAASAKPVPRKHKRKKAKLEAKPAEAGKQDDVAHADAHATPVPTPVAPTARVHVKDRAAAAAAVAASQAAAHDDHAAPAAADAANDAHQADAHAAPVAAADARRVPDAHDAPPVPATIAPTRRARVRAAQAATPMPAVAATAVDAPADAHGAADAHAAPDSVPARAEAVQDAAPAVAAADTRAVDECNPPLKGEIAALFDRWNASLRTGDPKKVVANYAPDSILLPTVSNRARFTVAEKEEYFMHFLQRRPQGYIDDRMIDVDCNSATDAGLYTFRFADGGSVKARYSFAYRKINGQWLITSHHSSGMPEKAQAPVAHAAEQQPAVKAAESGGQVKGWVRFP